MRGEAGWYRQRRHSCVVIVVLAFELVVWVFSGVAIDSQRACETKRAAPRWEAAPRRRDSWGVRVTTSRAPPVRAAWGPHRSVPRSWRRATARRSLRSPDTGSADP